MERSYKWPGAILAAGYRAQGALLQTAVGANAGFGIGSL